jgi:hypothetical protein
MGTAKGKNGFVCQGCYSANRQSGNICCCLPQPSFRCVSVLVSIESSRPQKPPSQNIKITKRTHFAFTPEASPSITCHGIEQFSFLKRAHFPQFHPPTNFQPIPALAGECPPEKTRNPKLWTLGLLYSFEFLLNCTPAMNLWGAGVSPASLHFYSSAVHSPASRVHGKKTSTSCGAFKQLLFPRSFHDRSKLIGPYRT